VPFRFDANDEIEVRLFDISSGASQGDGTLLVLGTDYTLAGAGAIAGGTLTYPVSGDALTSNQRLVILRDLPLTQTLDLPTQGRIYPPTLEATYDRLAMQVQQLQEQVDRSLKYGPGMDSPPAATFPDPVASRAIGFDTAGDPFLYTIDAGGALDALNSIRQTVTATAGQAAFTTGFTYAPAANELAVYVNGVRQSLGDSAYTETDSTTVTFSEGLDAGDVVEFVFNEWTGTDVSDNQLRTDLITSISGSGASLVAAELKGTSSETVQDTLLPTLGQWVDSGSGTSGDPWVIGTASLAALNTYLATDGGVVSVPVGYYQTNGVIHIGSTNSSGLIGDAARATWIQSTDPSEPVIRVTGRHQRLENLSFGYTVQPGADTSAIGLSVQYTSDTTGYCTFRNLYISKVYTGVGTETGTKLSFNNYYENIQVQSFDGWGLYLEDSSSGDVFDSVYITNNATGLTSVGLITLKGDHKSTIRQLNLEHATVSSSRPIKFGSGKITVDGLHIEDIDFTSTTVYIIAFSGTYSQITINNIELNSVVTTAAAQTGNVFLFDFFSTGGAFRITGTRLWSDVSLEAGGTLYYADLTNTDADDVEIYIEDFIDLSIGDTAVRYLGPTNGTNATALRWFDDEPWGYAGLHSVEFDASSGAAIGTHTLAVLPKNTTIVRAWYEVLTTFTSATDAATIQLGVQTNDAAGLVAATAISAGGNIWDAGYFDTLADGTAANFTTKTTNLRNLNAVVAVEALTAGRFRLWYETATAQ
jgi:hypothetical protein